MGLNMDSILAKAKAAIKTGDCKKRYDATVKKIMLGNIKLKSGATVHTPEEAADKFIEVLKNTIDAVPSSIMSENAKSAISSLAHTAPVAVGDGTYLIKVYFSGDLSRPSLYPEKYGGLNDLAVMLNDGMSAKNHAYGMWHGEYIRSRTTFPGTYFMDAAVDDFLGNYAAEYNVISCTVDRSF